MKKLANWALREMVNAGADEAQAVLTRSSATEINLQDNAITLMRTMFDTSASLTVLKDRKSGKQSVNDLTEDALRKAAAGTVEMAASSQSDDANAIADKEPGITEYAAGPAGADRALMLERLDEFLQTVKEKAPQIKLEGHISFTTRTDHWENTRGMAFDVTDGRYLISVTFSAKDGDRTSSMNGAGALSRLLDTPLWELGGIGGLMLQSVAELDAKPMEDKFEGDIVLSPTCLGDFLQMYAGTFLSSGPLIAGTSPLKDKLGQPVAHQCLTVTSNLTEPGICGYPVTSDGFRAEDMTVIESGVLKSFILGLYGSRKTGLPRSKNLGDHLSVRPGDVSHTELIAGVKRGLLVCRFSGGSPSENGDFSGVAKNSFLIEDGRLAYPVSETMISGNLLEVFKSVSGISSDTVFNGDTRQPWLRAGGIIIS